VEGRIPWLVQKAMESPEEVREYKDDVCIDSKEKLQELIQRHPDVMEIRGFPKMLRHANAYLDLIEWQRNGGSPEMMQTDIARDLGISSWMVCNLLVLPRHYVLSSELGCSCTVLGS
ncbi:MAG: hypothetical protein ACTSPR_06500, partial [Candidatus Thorarchaeota archaeon]